MKRATIALLAILLLLPMAASAQKSSSGKPATPKNIKALERKVLGKHFLTLQWISWEYLGTVKITKASDGTLRCKGEQLSRGDDSHIGDYLKIDGTMRIISALELEFTGTIRTKIWHINNGNEVVREGTFTFLSTQGRRYWRLQQKKNPADGCIDYIDISF
ncbi:MAG: hypothetical protein J6M53_01115 [Bacteroidaceae bacterium]|nr:hypothetical protein [Bacteroidaceae bacterium]